ncbi:MAG: hypothetical protein AAB799_00790 [Patescibacteria group bacterium]
MVISESKFFIAMNIKPIKNNARSEIKTAPRDDSIWIVKMLRIIELFIVSLSNYYGRGFIWAFRIVIAEYAFGRKSKSKETPLRHIANAIKAY